jgi:uncharacterized cupin superfamily protein
MQKGDSVVNLPAGCMRSVLWGRTRVAAIAVLLWISGGAGAAETPAWVRVDKAMLAGALPPNDSADSGLPRNYFDEIEPAQGMRFGFAHIGANTTSIFQTTRNSSRSFDFPGDEIVRVMSGTITLFDEPSGRVQTFYPRDYFVVPRHWRGLWIFHNLGGEPAREFVTLSGSEWGPERAPLDRASLSDSAKIPGSLAVDPHYAESQLAPMRFENPGARSASGNNTPLGYIIFAGEPSFLMLQATQGATYDRPVTRCESTVTVLSGSLTLDGARGKSETFGPDDSVVITREFHGKIRASPGFAALSAIAAGRENLDSPTVVPAVSICPAM